MCVVAILDHQLLMIAALYDAAVLDHDDLVGHAHSGEATATLTYEDEIARLAQKPFCAGAGPIAAPSPQPRGIPPHR